MPKDRLRQARRPWRPCLLCPPCLPCRPCRPCPSWARPRCSHPHLSSPPRHPRPCPPPLRASSASVLRPSPRQTRGRRCGWKAPLLLPGLEPLVQTWAPRLRTRGAEQPPQHRRRLRGFRERRKEPWPEERRERTVQVAGIAKTGGSVGAAGAGGREGGKGWKACKTGRQRDRQAM
jgi:hypothetical protein